jgi:hypothetical protein
MGSLGLPVNRLKYLLTGILVVVAASECVSIRLSEFNDIVVSRNSSWLRRWISITRLSQVRWWFSRFLWRREAARRHDDVQQRLIRVCLLVRVAATHAWTIVSISHCSWKGESSRFQPALCASLSVHGEPGWIRSHAGGRGPRDRLHDIDISDVSTILHLNAAIHLRWRKDPITLPSKYTT